VGFGASIWWHLAAVRRVNEESFKVEWQSQVVYPGDVHVMAELHCDGIAIRWLAA